MGVEFPGKLLCYVTLEWPQTREYRKYLRQRSREFAGNEEDHGYDDRIA